MAIEAALTSGQTTSRPFICPADGNFPIPGERCSPNYFTCVNDTPYTSVTVDKFRIHLKFYYFCPWQTCPGVSVFDPNTLLCKSPSSLNCTSMTISQMTIIIWILFKSFDRLVRQSNNRRDHHTAVNDDLWVRVSRTGRNFLGSGRCLWWKIFHLHRFRAILCGN